MHTYEILIRPIVTEKAVILADYYNQYTFEVDRRANKHQIKDAVERAFDVEVTAIKIINVAAKMGRHGRRRVISKSARKKAVVTLAAGQRIDFFEGA
jgi:large subunit ribosomal protein L23